MHLGTGVVQRRNAEEGIILLLSMMVLFHDRRMHQAGVCVKDRLRETCGAGGEVNCAVIVVCDDHTRCGTGIVCCLGDEILSKGGASGADIQKKPSAGNTVRDLLNTADKFGSEDEDVCFRELDAVFDLVRAVAEVQRYRDRAGLEDSEVDRKPVQAVHEKNGNLIALDDAAGNEHVGHAVCLLIKNSPCDLLTARYLVTGLDQFIFFPGCQLGNLDIRI